MTKELFDKWRLPLPRPSRWEDVVRASATAFRENGYEKTTIEDIAQRVGILKGSLYNYIDSKEDLLFAVIRTPAELLLEELDQMRRRANASASRRLHRLFRVQVSVFEEYFPAPFVYLQQIGRPTQPDEYREMDRRYVSAVESIVADGQESGEFSVGVSPLIVARAIVGMLNWMQHWYDPERFDSSEEVADGLFSLAIGGLASSGWVETTLNCWDTADRGTVNAP